MKAFLAALVFIAVTASGAAMVLNANQQNVADTFVTSGVRLGSE